MKECFIGLGKWSSFYFFILGNILSRLVTYYFSSEDSSPLKESIIMRNIYKYIGFILFGCIFYFINKKNTNKNISKKQNNPNELKLIHYDALKTTNKDKISLVLICLICVIHFDSLILINSLKLYVLNFWTFKVFFLLLFMHYYFPSNIYIHHKISMGFIIIVNSILLIYISNLKTIKKQDQYLNIYEDLNSWMCSFIIFCYILIKLCKSFSQVKEKVLIDFKYFSPYTIIIIIGLIGFIINIFLAIFMRNKRKDFDLNNYEDMIYYYYSLSEYIKCWTELEVWFLEIIKTIIYIIFSFLIMAFELLIIKSPSFT